MLSDTESNVRVVIADDHPVFVAGLRTMLEALPCAEVVGTARTGKEAVVAAQQLQPDVMLMDVDMPELNGIEATRVIASRCPRVGILILSVLEDEETVVAAVRVGARGYLVKGAGLDDVAYAVMAVHTGSSIFGPKPAERIYGVVTGPRRQEPPFPQLTTRERAVLEMVASGRGNHGIAKELGLSVKTVQNHLSRIFTKLEVSNRTEAVIHAHRAGLGL